MSYRHLSKTAFIFFVAITPMSATGLVVGAAAMGRERGAFWPWYFAIGLCGVSGASLLFSVIAGILAIQKEKAKAPWLLLAAPLLIAVAAFGGWRLMRPSVTSNSYGEPNR